MGVAHTLLCKEINNWLTVLSDYNWRIFSMRDSKFTGRTESEFKIRARSTRRAGFVASLLVSHVLVSLRCKSYSVGWRGICNHYETDSGKICTESSDIKLQLWSCLSLDETIHTLVWVISRQLLPDFLKLLLCKFCLISLAGHQAKPNMGVVCLRWAVGWSNQTQQPPTPNRQHQCLALHVVLE